MIETPDRTGVVIELKYAQDDNLERECREALAQIDRKHYEARLLEDGMERIVKYGVRNGTYHFGQMPYVSILLNYFLQINRIQKLLNHLKCNSYINL